MSDLVICIGNKARGDDGAARYVAELLESENAPDEMRLPPATRVISKPQLDIVMAEDVRTADFVVFVDAERRQSPPVRIESQAHSIAGSHAHALDPGGLLALSASLYDSRPDAVLVSIAGPEMPHRDGLSECARAASEEAARRISHVIRKRTS